MNYVGAALAAMMACAPAIGWASEPDKADAPKTGHREVIVIRSEEGGDVKPDLARCEADQKVDIDQETKDKDGKRQRARIILCPAGEVSSAAMIERLEKTRERLAKKDALSDAIRSKVLAALDEAIARQRKAAAE